MDPDGLSFAILAAGEARTIFNQSGVASDAERREGASSAMSLP